MKSIQRILVIVDPTVERDFVLDRAKEIASSLNIEFRFFINNSNTLKPQTFSYPGIDSLFFEKQHELFREHYEKLLDQVVDEFSETGSRADHVFTDEHNLAESIIQQVGIYKPDLVLKSTHHHSIIGRSLVTNTDWRLIRKCPAPLLLVKPEKWLNDGSIVASVDPLHARAEQSRLDPVLIDTAEFLASNFRQTPRIFHCYFPFVGTMYPSIAESNEQIREIRGYHESRINELLGSHNISPSQVELARGELVPTLLRYLKNVKANILVIGALSRNAVERAIVGNTAERILDDCPCDVLVIKTQT